MSMEGVEHGEPRATVHSTDLNETDTEESDLQLVKAVSEMAARLTMQERGKLQNTSSTTLCVVDYHHSYTEECSLTP